MRGIRSAAPHAPGFSMASTVVIAHTCSGLGDLMKQRGLIALAVCALAAAALTPVAQAAVADDRAPALEGRQAQLPGAYCEWGTEPAQEIPRIEYSRGYLYGPDWLLDHPSPYECSLGPAWTPVMHYHPYSYVQASSALYGAQSGDLRMCTSLADPECAPGKWVELYAESALGVCATSTDFNCVERLEVIDPSGAVQQARYLRGFPAAPGVPEFNQGGVFMPAGGSTPLWEYDVPGGTARILSVGKTDAVFRVSGGRWTMASPSALFKFILRPVTIDSKPGIPKPTMALRTDPNTGAERLDRVGWNHPDAMGCAAIDQGECARDVDFPKDYRYRVVLRMRDASSMYLNGAVSEPLAYSEKVEGGHRFTIEAAPSPVLGMAGWIPKSQVPRSLVDGVFDKLGFNYNWEVDFDAASHRPLGRGGVDALAWLSALMPYFGDRASFVVDSWYVENTPTLGQYTSQCTSQSKGEFIGIVSSNATAYTGDPPTYDAATSTLKYEVAGPHYMPDGTTLSRGRYSINMNANFVKCLLGVDKVPSVARVELTYPDGEASAATLALKQDKNWLRLYYENFTFSSPTVSVKFPKSFTCFKGKGKRVQSKKFTGFECPKGWRPKR